VRFPQVHHNDKESDDQMKPYPKDSWIDPRIEIRTTASMGKGMFAHEPIRAGECVIIWGGTVFTEEERKRGLIKKYTTSGIAEGLYLGSKLDDPDVPDQFMNHSCDPSLWMKDENTLMARRDIATGDEVTADYAMWTTDENWAMDEACRCGSSLCRTKVTGNDWKLNELRERYQGHFVPFINERIKSLKISIV